MEEITSSDLKTNPTMQAAESFNHILKQVQTSCLNFHLQISPFSAVISIKKSFIRDKSGDIVLPPPILHHTQNQKFEELVAKNLQLEASKQLEDELRAKLDAAEVEVSRLKKEAEEVIIKKNEEVNILKKAMKASKEDNEKLCSELKNFKKIVSSKDKEINRLEEQTKLLKTLNEQEFKKADDDFKEQLAAKDAKLCDLSKEILILQKAKDSLLDLLYGCNEYGRFGDACECDADEENNVEPSDSCFFNFNDSLTQPDHFGFPRVPPSPPPTEISETLHLRPSAWTPPATPPCSSCGSDNYGPCPASVCFACLPSIETRPPTTSSCSTTPPGTPPTLRWSQQSLHVHENSSSK